MARANDSYPASLGSHRFLKAIDPPIANRARTMAMPTSHWPNAVDDKANSNEDSQKRCTNAPDRQQRSSSDADITVLGEHWRDPWRYRGHLIFGVNPMAAS